MINGIMETGRNAFVEGVKASWKGAAIGAAAGGFCAKSLLEQSAHGHAVQFGGPFIGSLVQATHLVVAGAIAGTAAGFVAGFAKGIFKPEPAKPYNDPSFILGALAVSTSIAIPLHVLLNTEQ